MQEELVAIIQFSPTRQLVEIREPGSQKKNDSQKLVAIKKIECTLDEAEEIYMQLRQLLKGEGRL